MHFIEDTVLVNFIGLGEVPLEIIFQEIVVSLFSSINFSIWQIKFHSLNFHVSIKNFNLRIFENVITGELVQILGEYFRFLST